MARNGSLERSPVHLLHRAVQCVDDIFKGEVSNLTPRQLAVLIAVAAKEGGNQTDLVNATGVDRSTMADLVKRLSRKGFLQRRRTAKDARAYAVKLTDQGRRALN